MHKPSVAVFAKPSESDLFFPEPEFGAATYENPTRFKNVAVSVLFLLAAPNILSIRFFTKSCGAELTERNASSTFALSPAYPR